MASYSSLTDQKFSVQFPHASVVSGDPSRAERVGLAQNHQKQGTNS